MLKYYSLGRGLSHLNHHRDGDNVVRLSGLLVGLSGMSREGLGRMERVGCLLSDLSDKSGCSICWD